MPGLRLTGPDEAIDIRVVADPAEDQVVFKMRKRMQLQRLIDAFHAHRRKRAGTYIFFYNSHEVTAADTPESLQMSRNDFVLAAPNPAYGQQIIPRSISSQSFYITVVDSDGLERECLFRVRRTTRMMKLMEVYEDRTSNLGQSRLFYYEGKPVLDDDTPESLGMYNPGFAYVVVSTLEPAPDDPETSNPH